MGKKASTAKGKKPKKTAVKTPSKDATQKIERKTMTIPKTTYDHLASWKGGERRGISFAEAIDRLLDHAEYTGYKSALATPKKKK